MSDVLDLVIDPGCAIETLRRWLSTPDDEPVREVLCPAVAVLSCGHRRPTNSRDRRLRCLVCGEDGGVVGVELLPEPRWFPHPDALSDLPEPS